MIDADDRSVPYLLGAPGSTGIVVVTHPDQLPTVAWSGVVVPGLTAQDVVDAAPPALSLLAEHSFGWFGRPGLAGHRPAAESAAWSPRFQPVDVVIAEDRMRIDAVDTAAGLRMLSECEAIEGGALRVRHTVTNTAVSDYHLSLLEAVLPIPDRITESLDFTGRWARERIPQRRAITDGLWLRENRRGKTAQDAATMLIAGTADFGFGNGEVWGVHVAWSGNSVHRLERVPLGKDTPTVTSLGGGELLLPGEIILAAGQSYQSPWVFFAAANNGLDGLAARFHGWLRSRPAHPATKRPVTLNVWEAVYFNHDLPTLQQLADIAADVGVERYVLDDGWFGSRRHEGAGLGDWVVSAETWPNGLSPLVDHVRGLGMEFGLWFEPEMVNPDSDLYRAHPDWIMATADRIPTAERQQQVLDLTHPDAYAHVLDQMSAVLDEYQVDYVKWDHNRELLDAGSARISGRPAVHAQTLAFYRLLDQLRSRFPQVEWESCASGGGRVDLGVLERVQRIWTSDQNDALARQHIQRWTAQLVPAEYLGAHVPAPRSHQTGRVLPLELRAATALFGHFGIEWDLTSANSEDLSALSEWVGVYRDHRALVHSGRLLRVESTVDGYWIHGVISDDRSEALVAVVQLDELTHEPPRIRIPTLDAHLRYTITRQGAGASRYWPPARATGAVLADLGLPGPPAQPNSAVVLYLSS